MSYDLRAVIAGQDVLRVGTRDLSVARLASIGQGLSLMPMTYALFEAVTDGSGDGTWGFRWFPGGFEKVLAGWSAGGPVAYVEAEYFGGVGEQRAAVWDAGTMALAPLHVDEGEPFPPAGSPVSQALRRLGVVAGAAGDEFSAVGLDRHRHSEAWVS
ncbi:hypothetical protein SAMN06272771_0142 [Streptomyces sp. Ag82_O1-12]|uniref:hypothetical protein n=1 Tax=unclassified Streptomyces TaxID=2593676 RepID=UPI000BDAA92C|nr:MULTISPECIES: hypothetical protein [unclassified Streptomyces]SMQ13864.1 hypothetical protein SAMN06272771_0142 [Streptomyces sp. Ag82_O1-12]SOD42894.1 hypothetical protein SAMN06272727_0132 [Streptomyces sp. Ag82_G6-1]